MKNTVSARYSIRFRRWSRKAYAAFASLGKYVTIGSLRKSVADRSLSKQKATGTAGHAGCEEESTWKGTTEGRETAIGIPFGSTIALINGLTGPGTNLQVLFRFQVTCSCVIAGKQDEYYLKQRNHTGTDYRDWYGTFSKPHHIIPVIRTSFLSIKLITEGYDRKRAKRTGVAR